MKKKFHADPMNVLGAVLVILLVFIVMLTAFLLISYERMFAPADTSEPSETTLVPGADTTSSPEGDVTVLPGDTSSDDVTSKNESDRVTSSPADTTNTPSETTTPPAVTTPAETTAKSPAVTEPPSGKKLVALTYDDGPHVTYTVTVLDVLKKYNVKATFFILGTNTRKEDAKAALIRTAAEGHEIANHTYSHPTVLNLTVDELKDDIQKSSDAIYNVCGVRPTLLRTPGGKWSNEILENIKYPIIHWTVDTRDWEHNDPEKCLEYLKKQVYDGAIILMHDRKSNSAKSSEVMIEWLLENGYEIVTVSELMERKGVELSAGKVYFSSSNVRGKK